MYTPSTSASATMRAIRLLTASPMITMGNQRAVHDLRQMVVLEMATQTSLVFARNMLAISISATLRFAGRPSPEPYAIKSASPSSNASSAHWPRLRPVYTGRSEFGQVTIRRAIPEHL